MRPEAPNIGRSTRNAFHTDTFKAALLTSSKHARHIRCSSARQQARTFRPQREQFLGPKADEDRDSPYQRYAGTTSTRGDIEAYPQNRRPGNENRMERGRPTIRSRPDRRQTQPSEPIYDGRYMQQNSSGRPDSQWDLEQGQRDRRQRGYQEPPIATRQSMSSRQSQVPSRVPRQLPRFSPPRGEQVLGYNQVVNKEVISRGSGMSMGVISHFFADPDTLSVVSANLRPKGIFGNTPLQAKVGNVMLETFCQVGDVVLVHDESALEYSPTSGRYRGTPQDERGGFVNLIGCQICTSQGQSLGKVKSFSFSPDSGKIDCIQYDEIGLSWLLPALIGTWEIGVEYVALVDSDNALVLLPGAEAKRTRVANGWLEVAFIGLQNIFSDNGIEQLSDVSYAEGVDAEWEAWRVKWAPYFLQHYNQLPPATRRDFDLFNRRYEQQSNFVQPKYLPPARDLPPAPFAENPQSILQRQTSNARYPPRQDPRLRPSQPQQPVARQRPPQRLAQSPQSQSTASVPLYEQPSKGKQPAFRQQDADGGYGSFADSMEYSNADSGPQFDDWLERQQNREPILRGQATGGARGPPYPDDRRFSSSPRARDQGNPDLDRQYMNSTRQPTASQQDFARWPEDDGGPTGGYSIPTASYERPAATTSSSPAAPPSVSQVQAASKSAPRPVDSPIRTQNIPTASELSEEARSKMISTPEVEILEQPLRPEDRNALWHESGNDVPNPTSSSR